MFEKHLRNSDILSKGAPQVFFKHFASKNQLPALFASGTLVENGRMRKLAIYELGYRNITFNV